MLRAWLSSRFSLDFLAWLLTGGAATCGLGAGMRGRACHALGLRIVVEVLVDVVFVLDADRGLPVIARSEWCRDRHLVVLQKAHQAIARHSAVPTRCLVAGQQALIDPINHRGLVDVEQVCYFAGCEDMLLMHRRQGLAG